MNERSPAGEPRVEVACFGREMALAVARVSSDADSHRAITSQWLTGGELTRAARFKVDHGRADFLAGRVAAKSALRALIPDIPAPAQWEIAGGEFQPPSLAVVSPQHAVTIAHAGGLGLALVHARRWRCGIDLEMSDRDAGDVIATQVADSETAWARAGDDPEDRRRRWLLLWTAREAQGKSFGTGLLDAGRLRPTEAWTAVAHGWRARVAGDSGAQIRAVVVGRWIVALVLPVEIEADAIAAWLAAVLA